MSGDFSRIRRRQGGQPMLTGEPLTIGILVRKFVRPISGTWILTLCEIISMALVPLFIGFAIDGLAKGDATALMQLAAVLAGLIAVSVVRRIYDTRVYGTIRVELGAELMERSSNVPVSSQNARLGMCRELVDFLEEEAPALMNSAVQLIVSLIVLFYFHPTLSYAALGSAAVMLAIYGVFHRRFFRLNAALNHQAERQVGILASNSSDKLRTYLGKLRRIEIRLSDTEACVYGAIFLAMMALILFNLWLAATNIETTTGTVFSIISYSWGFVESALVLPVALQGWSRLSEIMQRINKPS